MRRTTWLLLVTGLGIFLAACSPTDSQLDMYTISGTITTTDGSPLEGVNVNFGSAVDDVTTDADGNWQRTDLKGTVTITPTLAGYAFAPASEQASEAADDVDFTAHPAFALSGAVTDDDGDPVPDVTIRLEYASLEALTTTDADGQWEQTGLYGTVNVTPEDAAYTFTPPTHTAPQEESGIDFQGAMKACNSGDPSTPLDPCVLSRIKQLQKIQGDLAGHYALGADINATATNNWNAGEGFEPIGTETDPFTGSLDGRDHAIIELFIARSGSDHVGLFGYIGAGSEIETLTLTNMKISGGGKVGGLVGESDGGEIRDVHVTGRVQATGWAAGALVGQNDDDGRIEDSSSAASVDGHYMVGGLVGYLQSGLIDKSRASGAVTGTGSQVGGLVGIVNSAEVTNSSSTGNVTGVSEVGGLIGNNNGVVIVSASHSTGDVAGTDRVGGLIGTNGPGEIAESYSTGNVVGTEMVGGLIGSSIYAKVTASYSTGSVQGTEMVGGLLGFSGREEIKNSYATGDVKGEDAVGGLIGHGDETEVSESYSMSAVTGSDQVGGLLGQNSGSLTSDSFSTGLVTGISNVGGLIGSADPLLATTSSSYWDTVSSGQDNSAGGEGKTTDEMRREASFSGWDFTNTWTINEGTDYPDLRGNLR